VARSKAEKILEALKTMYQGYVLFPEFRVEAGHGYFSEKRVDLLAMHPHPSKRNERIAFEIKISRTDFNRELRKPLKRWAGMLFTNRFYFAAPKGLISKSDLPTECGLIEVDGGVGKVIVEAPWRESMQPTWPFVAALARRVFRVEEKSRVEKAE